MINHEFFYNPLDPKFVCCRIKRALTQIHRIQEDCGKHFIKEKL